MLNLETPRSIARSNLVQALALRLRVSLDDLYYALVTDAEVNPTKCNSLHAKYASGIQSPQHFCLNYLQDFL